MRQEMKKNESCSGHRTIDALRILHDDIQSVLNDHERAMRDKSGWSPGGWLRDAFHHSSPHTTLCWSSSLALFVCGIILIVAALVHDDSSFTGTLVEGLLVIVLVCLNIATVGWDSWLRHMEIAHRVHTLLEHVKECIQTCEWTPQNYPQLCSPYSPCITLQWTMRDGQLVNLPWALLVRGDLVEMRPGQQAPGHCIPADNTDEATELRSREVYSPRQRSSEDEEVTTPKARTPLQSRRYVLQETPYLTSLQEALDRALTHPISYHNKLRHLLMLTVSEQVTLPVILVLVLLMGVLRWAYLGPWVGAGHWSEMLLMQPVAVCLPLLPLVFPIAWTALNCFGMARIQALFHTTPGQVASDPFEECCEEQSQPYVSWRELWPQFVDFMRGRSAIPCRSANLLHVLGSVTALCCVDKKGILSWPNPTAEKVFFLRSSGPASCSSSMQSMNKSERDSQSDIQTDNNTSEDQQQGEEKNKEEESTQEAGGSSPQTVAEVLDLTHDHASPFRLQFDDPSWRKHLSSLKPLGLSILLNTCNMQTQENYTQFCSHVTCEAMHSEHLVPVTNRRRLRGLSEMAVLPGTNKCLCELAKQIGFQEQAQDVFQLEQQLSTFRHVQAELVRRDIKFARSLSLAKLKFPFPHMVAVVVRDKHSGALQLLSQGTADIILDSCEEFWDGRDLCPLSPDDRRKVQDFYQRTSLTAYCTAFAYRPLSSAPAIKLSSVYLELPADSKQLYAQNANRTSLSLDNVSTQSKRENSQESLTSPINYETVSDVEGCFELQCNQVFVGMVTMQYQAQTDMVQLIEQLERACIRFVHFSKENELRSRVFSEKMGLESGWNCHISLLSERVSSENGSSNGWNSPNKPSTCAPRDSSHTSLPRYAPTPPRKRHESAVDETDSLIRERPLAEETKNMSFSAPSAINLDFSQVKFEQDDIINRACDWGDDKKKGSKDSVLVQSIDLTTHPDDACRSLSVLTDSTEQSAPVNFDMSNRAKLPRGIDKIRPHLENIDNVPLLVSLFTDCTPTATREMLSIMQEYGEVVCAMGSSANADNMSIFMQADASMAVEPLYPQVCQRVPVFTPLTRQQGPSPVELSRSLNSVACSVSFLREDPISIFHLIMECRHFMQCVTNCIQFWLSSSIAVSLIQVIAILVLLPPLFTTGQVLWLQCIVIPILSLSLVGMPTDAQIMQRATGKNQCCITTEACLFVLWFYGSKFAPAAVILIGLYAGSLASLCPMLPGVEGCSVLYPTSSKRGWGDHLASLTALQHAACLLLVIYLIVISLSFVHRHAAIWSVSPAHNKLWLLAVLLVVVLQLCFSALTLGPLVVGDTEVPPGLSSVPLLIYMLAAASPLLVFLINELVKQQEIKASVRQQKKARLEFGTKLGMNSPF